MTKLNRLFKSGDHVRIKEGALVWQRYPTPGYYVWPENQENRSQVFKLESYQRKSFVKIIAYGYGIIEVGDDLFVALLKFGKGPIYIEENDLENGD